MKIGFASLMEYASLSENAFLGASLGFDFVEINMNLPQFSPDRLAKALAEDRAGLSCTIHLDENLNPFDFNPYVAGAYLKTALETVRIARDAGIPIVNMHFPMGVYFTLPGEKTYLFDRYRSALFEKMDVFRESITKIAGQTKISIENTSFGGLLSLTEALEFLLESPAFSLTYDVGHDCTDGFRARAFYEKHEDRIRHMHFHQAAGGKNHLPPDESGMNMAQCLLFAEKLGASVVTEVKTKEGLIRSAKWLHERNYI